MVQLTQTKPQAVATEARVGKHRYLVLLMITLGIAVNYMDRATMSVALPSIKEEFGLSPAISGVLLSAFFWTYASGQLPMGYLAGRLGPRKMIALSALTFGLATIGMGFAWGVTSIIVLRLLLGIGEAPGFPAAAQAVSQWFPRSERGFASGTFNNGNPIGSTLSVPLVALLISWTGWRHAFVVAGLLAVVYAIVWWFFYRSPTESKQLSKAELDYIQADGEASAKGAVQDDLSWPALFKQRTIWAMMIGFFCVNFCAYFFITWFPSYLVSTYNLSLLKLGFLGMIPGIASMIGGWTGGLVSDWLVRRGTDLTVARKVCLVGGLLGTSTIGLAVLSPTVGMALLALSASYFSSTFAAASVWCLPGDVAPANHHVGSIGGIQNAAANLAGIISPILMGVITGITSSFELPLIIAGCVALIGAANYAFLLPRLKPLSN
jgi:ACS family glucarate transporter-like MFS transporter